MGRKLDFPEEEGADAIERYTPPLLYLRELFFRAFLAGYHISIVEAFQSLRYRTN